MSHLDNERKEDIDKTQKIDEYKKQIQDLKNTLNTVQETKKIEYLRQDIKEDETKKISIPSNENFKSKKKLSVKKKIIIFLLVFTIVCIGITSFAIYYKKSNTKIPIVEEKIEDIEEVVVTKKEIIPDGLGIKSLLETYDCNDLEIIEQEYHEGKKVTEANGSSYWPLEIRYIKIKGLKDKEIENKINEEIKAKSFELLEENKKYLDDPKVKSINVNAYTSANFSNVLSIEVYCYITCKEYEDEKNYPRKSVGLNYNLSTGEKIEFKDLFTNTVSIKNILSQSAYSSFAWDYDSVLNDEHEPDLSKVDYSEIEDRILRVMQYYNSGKSIEFNFGNSYISVYINDEHIYIEMDGFYKDIAIFNRFLDTENLYDGTYKGRKNLFVLKGWGIDDYYYAQIGEHSDNLFTVISLGGFSGSQGNKSENEKQLYEMYKNEINEEISKCNDYLKNNPNKAMVLSIQVYARDDINDYYIQEWEENKFFSGEMVKYTRKDTCELNIRIFKYIVSKDFYNSTFLNHVIETSISNYGELYVWVPEEMKENVTEEYEEIYRYYEPDLSKYYIYNNSELKNAYIEGKNTHYYLRTGERIYDAKTHKEILPEEEKTEETIENEISNTEINNTEINNNIQNNIIENNTINNITINENKVTDNPITNEINNFENNQNVENITNILSNSIENQVENIQTDNTIENIVVNNTMENIVNSIL